MSHGRFVLIIALAVATVPASARLAPPDAVLVIAHANLIDGISAAPLRDATVLVRGKLIEKVQSGAFEVPTGATVLDLKGRWLLPGLVDAHAHLYDIAAARAA